MRHVVLAACLLATAASSAIAQNSHPGQQQPHQHHAPDEKQKKELPPFIPPITDEDRKAAFPNVEGHAVHDGAVNYFVLLDQLEWQSGGDASGLNLDSRGWIGRDVSRFWFRADGEGEDGRVGEARAHLLYGRRFSRWWDFVAGVRQDFRPGSPQTWAAIGLQGLAPYRFDVELTAYVGASGRTQATVAVEYDVLLTNRLMVQPLFEAEVAGKSDPERGVGAGLSRTDVGLRLRYELRREIAPYVGVTWSHRWGETADFAEAAGEDGSGARFVTGVRLWF